MLLNRTNLTSMFRGYQMVFQGALEQAPSLHQRVAMEVPSMTSEEQYAWLGTMPRFREWLGDRVVQNLKTHDYTIKNKAFENTIAVRRDHIEDDKFGVYNPLVQNLGFEAKTHPDELVFQQSLLVGDQKLCFDGQYFFDTDHPVVAADGSVGTYSNWGGGAGDSWYLIDMSRPIKPIILQKRKDYDFVSMTEPTQEAVFMRGEFVMGIDARLNVGYGLPQLAFGSRQPLTQAAYIAARAQMRSVKGDNGKVLNINPGLLLVPPSLEGVALDILKSQTIENGRTNTMRDTAELLVVPWLS